MKWLSLFGRPFAALLVFSAAYAVTGWLARIQTVTVVPGGDYNLAVTPNTGIGAATLVTEDVHRFHLEQNASAGGHKITSVPANSTAGDALRYGEAVTGTQFTGSLPAAQFATGQGVLRGTIAIPPTVFAGGDCIEPTTTIAGATTSMVAGASMQLQPLASVPIGIAARVSALNTVMVRVCAATAVTTLARTATVAVFP